MVAKIKLILNDYKVIIKLLYHVTEFINMTQIHLKSLDQENVQLQIAEN